MASGRRPTLGQITFRLPAELHADLLEAAQGDDADVSDVLRCLIGRYLGKYRAKGGQKGLEVDEAEAKARLGRLARAQATAVSAGRPLRDRERGERLHAMLLACVRESTPLAEADLVQAVARAEEALCLEDEVARILERLARSGQVERAQDACGETRVHPTGAAEP